MVPPLFLDVQPHHRVLDMCAAPGSKTGQLLEALHAGDGVPSGFVVANDADAARCNLLTHQTKRICSPCLAVTNHGAERYPELRPAGGDALRFDRILCDVPCSGDGTMRKAPDIWRRWSVNGGNGLHHLQLKIALHAAKLLKARPAGCCASVTAAAAAAAVADAGLRLSFALWAPHRPLPPSLNSRPKPSPPNPNTRAADDASRWAAAWSTPPAPSTPSRMRRWSPSCWCAAPAPFGWWTSRRTCPS